MFPIKSKSGFLFFEYISQSAPFYGLQTRIAEAWFPLTVQPIAWTL